MSAYKVSYKLRSETKDMTPTEVERAPNCIARVSASNVPRAISQVVNEEIALGNASSKADLIILEVAVAP